MKSLIARRMAGITLVLSTASLLVLTAIPAFGDHVSTYPDDPEANKASFWENFGATFEGEDDWVCNKTNNTNNAPGGYQLQQPPEGNYWRLLVVKAGSDHNDLYWNPTPGSTYAATGQGAGGWSHVIYCYRPIPDDDDTTTTTEEETTTTTEQETTTTTEQETTTTTEEETTTTVAPTTTEQETTTTAPVQVSSTVVVSTTEQPEVGPTVVTTAPSGETTPTSGPVEAQADSTDDTEDTLPFTGVDSDDMAKLAIVALAAGSGLILLTKNDERGSHRV